MLCLLVNKDMSDDVAYQLTKAMFENLDDAHSVNSGLKPLTLENAFDFECKIASWCNQIFRRKRCISTS